MRVALMCLTVGLVASGALGATTIAMVDHETGSSTLDVTVPGVAGSVRTIDIMITTDENNVPIPASGTGHGGLVSWGINHLQPPGPGFLLTSRITTANYAIGDAFNWDSTMALTSSKGAYPTSWPALPGLMLGTICYVDIQVNPALAYPAISGQAMSFQITLPASNVPLGQFYVPDSNDAYAGRFPSGDSAATFVPLTLTPEPATFLLLMIGVLGLIRRRRA